MQDSLFSSGQSIFGTRSSDEGDINMIAFLSILSNMLFFLLASFGLAIISLIGANVPTIAEENTVFTVDKKQLIMNISITRERIDLIANNEMLTEKEIADLKRTFPRTARGFDFEAINDYLYALKKEFNKSETVVITPDPDIPYDILVKVMDASREKVIRVEGKPFRYPLFPSAVISTMVK